VHAPTRLHAHACLLRRAPRPHQHLDEEKPEGAENEAVEQVVFADKILLNKTDLIGDEAGLAEVEARLRALNKSAPIVRCENAVVALDELMDIHAFDLQEVLKMEPDFLSPDAEHVHDETITSVGITIDGDLDLEKLNGWIARLLREQGTNIYRMKGILAVAGSQDKFVFQGVHMMFDGKPLSPWGDEARRNRMIFIGKKLDKEALTRSFTECLAA
jgi:G3E family GTPase